MTSMSCSKLNLHKKQVYAFSLIELIVVVAVMAALVAVISMHTYEVVQAANEATDEQNASVWNTAYTTVVASGYVDADGKRFENLEWSEASKQLANGINIIDTDADSIVYASIPSFHNVEPDKCFQKGIGLVISSLDD